MSINETDPILHNIRVKLYPNRLRRQIKGKYIARTSSEASLAIEQVCKSAKERGGFTGSLDDLIKHVRVYFDEAAWQLCDGFSIDTGYYSVRPVVCGTFDTPDEAGDRAKHPIGFRFRAHAALNNLARYIDLTVAGIVTTQGCIDKFTDLATGDENKTLTPGGMFAVSGYKIKIAGAGRELGLYFEDEAGTRTKARIGENRNTKLVGIIPPLPDGAYRVSILTQYSRGGLRLKEARSIVSGFTLTAGRQEVSVPET